ncbi:MAG: HAD-IA family hydrolase [Sphingomonas sp.]|uniref:HAD-IA family hydrolase n=1 Tax=Sphingomonas sp. TaxID=28214 RepID=UPI001AC4DEB3|nr:HAD-IA family hydrolase [Sphingomonas sp.]MBN8807126.1 HAD-IA family hydrolase [Sphingomonas sp.]
MADFPFALIGFDLDGTLVDSAADLAASVNHVLATIGRAPLTVGTVRTLIGGGGRRMLQRALLATGGDAELDTLLPVQTAYYDAHIADRTRPYPHVVKALAGLAARGVTLAVVTNKRESAARLLLGKLGLLDRFACVIGGDSLGGIMKPDPAPIRDMVRRCGGGSAAFVGDSAYDVRAGKAAGVPVATFGAVPDADAVFTDYADLIPTLERLAAR